MENSVNQLKRPVNVKFWVSFGVIAVILSVLYYLAFTNVDLSYYETAGSTTDLILRFVWRPFFTPNVVENIPMYLDLMLETISIAFAGTLAGSIIAIPFGFLAARNMTGKLSYLGKGVLNGIRAFPDILFGIIFVASVSFGPFAGVLAISINSVGMLGKLYSEAIESIDMDVIQALKSTGAKPIQVLFYGVLPQVFPEFKSYALYIYEIDVRASTILGLVGAGGIGTQLVLDANQRSWESIGMMIYIIVITVIIIDQLSTRLRKKIV